MSDGFDVYHKWLSIPPSEQPPNHYRLLGLGLFESDPDVIAAAADRQMSHVQTYKNGPRAELSQKLLNEIASAKLCLLKPQKKEAYDEQLRQLSVEKQRKGPPGFMPVAPAVASGSPTNPGRSGAFPSQLPPPPIAAPPRIEQSLNEASQSPWGTKTGLTAGAVLIVLLIIAIWAVLKLGHGGDSSTQAEPKPTRQGADSAERPNSPAASAATTGVPTVPPEPAPTPTDAKAAVEAVNPSSSPSTKADRVVAQPAHPTTDVKPAQPSPNSTTTPPAAVTDVRPAAVPGAASAADSGADKKLHVVPDTAAQSAADARFADSFTDASPAAVLEKSKALTDGPLVYVALNRALAAAIPSGDVPVVGKLLDELSRRFTFDSFPLRAKSYLDLRQHVRATPAWDALAEATLAMIDEAATAGHPELAMPLAETSLLAARKANDLELIRKATLKVLELQAPSAGQGSADGGRGAVR